MSVDMLRSKSSKKPNPPNLKNLRQVPSTRTSITRDKNIPTNPSFDKLDLPTHIYSAQFNTSRVKDSKLF